MTIGKLLVVLLWLAGCTSTLDQVRAMTTADLDRAAEKSVKAYDLAGWACWQALRPIVSPKGGIASDIEDARIISIAVSGPCSGILNPIIMIIRP